MSEQENNAQPQQPSPLAEAIASATPEAPKPFAYTDTHTAQNTPMQHPPAPLSVSKRSLEEKDREHGFSSIFLGSGKAENEKAQELVGQWLGWMAVKDLHNQDKASATVYQAAKNDWEQYLERNYPGVAPEQLEQTAVTLYKFFQSLQDDILVRSRMMREEGISNASNRGSDLITSDIVGKVPGAATQGYSISEAMTRAAHRSQNSAYHYSVLCRNSFLSFTFLRADKMELANLVNDINLTVRGYVRRVGNNTMTLASIAGMKAVWEFIKPRIISCSVEGIVDFSDLGRLIRITDMQTVYSALLASATDDGVQMDLRCINAGCSWHKFDLVDPTKFVNVRYSIQTAEEAAIFGNIFADRTKYTPEQVLAMINQSKYGLESNFIYNAEQTIRLTINPPAIADAFVTFEYFVGQVEPQIADARTKVIDENALEEQLAILFASLGSSELVHWVSEFAIIPKGNVDALPVIYRRAESPAGEFNKGLLGALQADKALGRELTMFVYNRAPFMTRTFVGLRNYKCPECGTHSHEMQEEDRQLGYTPIDAFMTFFTHTQLMLMVEATKHQEMLNEARSNSTDQ